MPSPRPKRERPAWSSFQLHHVIDRLRKIPPGKPHFRCHTAISQNLLDGEIVTLRDYGPCIRLIDLAFIEPTEWTTLPLCASSWSL